MSLPVYMLRVPRSALPHDMTTKGHTSTVEIPVFGRTRKEALGLARKRFNCRRLPNGTTLRWLAIPKCRCRRCQAARRGDIQEVLVRDTLLET